METKDDGGTPIGQWLGRAIARWRSNPGSKVVTLEDPRLLTLTAHVRLKNCTVVRDEHGTARRHNETIGELCSRTGISAHFILTSSADEIKKFVDTATENTEHWKPQLAKSEQHLDIEYPDERRVNAVLVG